MKPLKPSVVLGVAAHADDLDFGASGTMAKFAADGAEVYYLILTDGSKGSDNYSLSSSQLIKIRQSEQQTALKALGGKDVTFLGYPDGYLEITMDLKKDIVHEIRRLKPDVVVTNDPTFIYSAQRGYLNHPDHRAAGQATLDAIFPLARDHLSFPDLYQQGLLPYKIKTVLLTNFEQANFYVDISSTIDKKWQALKAHASQIPDFASMQQRIEDLAKAAGKQAKCELAEAFMRIDLPQ